MTLLSRVHTQAQILPFWDPGCDLSPAPRAARAVSTSSAPARGGRGGGQGLQVKHSQPLALDSTHQALRAAPASISPGGGHGRPIKASFTFCCLQSPCTGKPIDQGGQPKLPPLQALARKVRQSLRHPANASPHTLPTLPRFPHHNAAKKRLDTSNAGYRGWLKGLICECWPGRWARAQASSECIPSHPGSLAEDSPTKRPTCER